MNLLRRNRAGVGWVNKAVAKQRLTVAAEWDSTAKDAHHMQFSTWNAGNLQRSATDDTPNDLLEQGRFHIACVQEAFAESVQHPLFDSRGVESSCSRDRTIMINAGGGGWK